MTNLKWREIMRKRTDGGYQKALFEIGARNQRYLLLLKTFELRSRSRQIRYNDWLVWLRKNNILIPTKNQNSMYHFLRDDGRNLKKVLITMYDIWKAAMVVTAAIQTCSSMSVGRTECPFTGPISVPYVRKLPIMPPLFVHKKTNVRYYAHTKARIFVSTNLHVLWNIDQCPSHI